jgi:competence protein ComGC
MRARALDEREHRRGLVLGLTMAESLLLLVFLLLLALSALLMRRERIISALNASQTSLQAELTAARAAQSELAPVLDQLRARGKLAEEQLEQLAARLTRAGAIERELTETNQKFSALQSELSQSRLAAKKAEEETRQYAEIIDQALQIAPEAPPASTLRRGVEILEKVGLSADLSSVASAMAQATEVRQQLGETQERYTALEQQYEKTRRERENLMRNGAGTTYPSCWTTPDGKNEFIFDVVVTDVGVIVRDAAPPHRQDDDIYSMIDPFEKGTVIQAARFDRATARLFHWSNEQECRFFVNLRDGTGAGSKQAYQRHRRLVEGHFYIRHLWK